MEIRQDDDGCKSMVDRSIDVEPLSHRINITRLAIMIVIVFVIRSLLLLSSFSLHLDDFNCVLFGLMAMTK